MAVCPGAIGGIDCIHIAIKQCRSLIHLHGIGGIWRSNLRGHSKLTGPQYALKSARGIMARQDWQVLPRYGFIVKHHDSETPDFRRTARNQALLPL
jgi:hypothetical protein